MTLNVCLMSLEAQLAPAVISEMPAHKFKLFHETTGYSRHFANLIGSLIIMQNDSMFQKFRKIIDFTRKLGTHIRVLGPCHF